MNLQSEENLTLQKYFLEHREGFEKALLDQAINVKDQIEKIHSIGNINLLENAHKLVLFIVEEREEELITFAKQEGIAWAKHSLTLTFKLEWIQAIRRTIWSFLSNLDVLNKSEVDRERFFILEKNINDLVDHFLTNFFISYSKYKDDLLEKQRELVDNLSVPIIPINEEISILPLIGTIDEIRLSLIQEKVLTEIENRHIQLLILDLSGVASLEEDITGPFINVIEGVSIMGCKTILTGLRAEFVTKLARSKIGFHNKAEFKGTLQLALNDVLVQSSK